MSEIGFVVNLSAEPVEDVLVDGCVEVVDDDAVVEYAAYAPLSVGCVEGRWGEHMILRAELAEDGVEEATPLWL